MAKMRAGGTIVTNDCYERLLRGPNNDRDFSEDSRLCAAVWSDARCDCFVCFISNSVDSQSLIPFGALELPSAVYVLTREV